MSRWPPLIWLMVTVGSLLILVGYNGPDYNPQALFPGLALILGAFGLSLFMAFGRWSHRPSPTGVAWLIPATATFYVLCAAAAVISGGQYAVAAILAGLIPLTAATLLTATSRAKTVGRDDDKRDVTAAAHDDPYPGIGVDDETPLGDTPEHSDAERVAKPDPRFARRQGSRSRD
jgi:peptidoglycan/LPS O-acetylase OafA/YrhL